MNKVFLIGRLTRDPELRYTSNNIAVATFSLAVNRNFTNNAGEREADFVNIVVWRKQAENVKNYLGQGSQVAIDGRIQSRSYTGEDGKKRYITEVIADNVEFLGTKKSNQGGNAAVIQVTPAAPEQVAVAPTTPVDSNNQDVTPYDFPDDQVKTTDVDSNPFADFGASVEISDDELPF